jgi:CheY-like chemotaxis protein
LPERIASDPARLRQLLMNLIGNAIKFTEQGGIRVIASTTTSLDPRLQIEVVDTGIGIPASKLESIFEPFTQADTSVTRRFGGTGLGLAISRKIATALGGDLTVASRVDEGSRFTLTLTTGSLRGVAMLSSPPVTAPVATTPKTRVAILPPARILVVDDGETNRKLVRLILQRAGAKIKTAENGKQAIEEAESDTFDAILMDMQMPILDGYSATRMLRSKGCQLPIIALTAHAMKGDEEKCRQAGCSGYMTKPIERQKHQRCPLQFNLADRIWPQRTRSHHLRRLRGEVRSIRNYPWMMMNSAKL